MALPLSGSLITHLSSFEFKPKTRLEPIFVLSTLCLLTPLDLGELRSTSRKWNSVIVHMRQEFPVPYVLSFIQLIFNKIVRNSHKILHSELIQPRIDPSKMNKEEWEKAVYWAMGNFYPTPLRILQDTFDEVSQCTLTTANFPLYKLRIIKAISQNHAFELDPQIHPLHLLACVKPPPNTLIPLGWENVLSLSCHKYFSVLINEARTRHPISNKDDHLLRIADFCLSYNRPDLATTASKYISHKAKKNITKVKILIAEDKCEDAITMTLTRFIDKFATLCEILPLIIKKRGYESTFCLLIKSIQNDEIIRSCILNETIGLLFHHTIPEMAVAFALKIENPSHRATALVNIIQYSTRSHTERESLVQAIEIFKMLPTPKKYQYETERAVQYILHASIRLGEWKQVNGFLKFIKKDLKEYFQKKIHARQWEEADALSTLNIRSLGIDLLSDLTHIQDIPARVLRTYVLIKVLKQVFKKYSFKSIIEQLNPSVLGEDLNILILELIIKKSIKKNGIPKTLELINHISPPNQSLAMYACIDCLTQIKYESRSNLRIAIDFATRLTSTPLSPLMRENIYMLILRSAVRLEVWDLATLCFPHINQERIGELIPWVHKMDNSKREGKEGKEEKGEKKVQKDRCVIC